MWRSLRCDRQFGLGIFFWMQFRIALAKIPAKTRFYAALALVMASVTTAVLDIYV
ncbi:hypothetical protein DSUL_260030 [Desulfovibrionales bacterium]